MCYGPSMGENGTLKWRKEMRLDRYNCIYMGAERPSSPAMVVRAWISDSDSTLKE